MVRFGSFLISLQRVAGVGNAVRLEGIGADEQYIIGVFHVLGGVAGLLPEQAAVDPEIAGLFLPQRVVVEAALHRRAQLPQIRAAQMVALAAAARRGEGVAAVLVLDGHQPLCDIVQRLVPADRLKAAVRLAAQRLAQAVVVVLVVFQPRRFLADVTLGERMVVVTPNR
jgi:hypothetical protein